MHEYDWIQPGKLAAFGRKLYATLHYPTARSFSLSFINQFLIFVTHFLGVRPLALWRK